jgi:serine/threonine protein kinase
LLPNGSKELVDLLNKLLAYDPSERITAKEALKHEYFSDLFQEKCRSTIFGMPHSHSINKATEHDNTPEKSMKIKKKRGAEQMNEDEVNSLPPIHQLRLDVKLNLYGATTKTQDNVFKKTLASINKRKDDFMVSGINAKKIDR